MPRKARQEDHARIYWEAAQEHKTLAVELHEARRYVMAHYVAGLAVECLLRAYRYRFDPAFDARHDLKALYAASRFGNVVPPEDEESIGEAFTEVVRRWSTNHRYRSEQALRDYLHQARLGHKGKFVRESSRRIVSAAIKIVEQGVRHWND